MMNKIINSILFITIFSFTGCLDFVDNGNNKEVNLTPYLQLATTNSILVKYKTIEKEKGCVNVYLSSGPKIYCEKNKSRRHTIKISNLEPDTSYKYEVISNLIDIDNTKREFTTLSLDKEKIQRIWVIGDSGSDNQFTNNSISGMENRLAGNKVDIFMTLGDNAGSSGTQEEYKNTFFKSFKNIIKTNVTWCIAGNHDSGSENFYDTFTFPQNGEAGGYPSNSEKFYSFNQGDIHIVMLDTQQLLFTYEEVWNWLKKDLKNNKQLWTIIAFHHPPYTKGSHDSDDEDDSDGRMFIMREYFNPLFETYNVDLVLSGHSHVYERSHLINGHYEDSHNFSSSNIIEENDNFNYTKCSNNKNNGTIYNVAGSTAKGSYNINRQTDIHPALPIKFISQGSVLITINKNVLKSEFIGANSILDTYTITKKVCE